MYNCTDSRVVEILEELGINYQKKDFSYQFGQPFKDFNDAMKFFANHYNIDSKKEKLILERFLKRRVKGEIGPALGR